MDLTQEFQRDASTPSIWIGESSPINSKSDLHLLSEIIWLYDEIYVSQILYSHFDFLRDFFNSIDDIKVNVVSKSETNGLLRKKIMESDSRILNLDQFTIESRYLRKLYKSLKLTKRTQEIINQELFFAFPILQVHRNYPFGYMVERGTLEEYLGPIKLARMNVYSDYFMAQILRLNCIFDSYSIEKANTLVYFKPVVADQWQKISNIETFTGTNLNCGRINLKFVNPSKKKIVSLIENKELNILQSETRRDLYDLSSMPLAEIIKFRKHPSLKALRVKLRKLSVETIDYQNAITEFQEGILKFLFSKVKITPPILKEALTSCLSITCPAFHYFHEVLTNYSNIKEYINIVEEKKEYYQYFILDLKNRNK